MTENNISCKKATVLMSKSLEQELSLQEKASLATHLAICKTCCFCQKQIISIRETLAHYADSIFHHSASEQHHLPPEAKERMKSNLKENL